MFTPVFNRLFQSNPALNEFCELVKVSPGESFDPKMSSKNPMGALPTIVPGGLLESPARADLTACVAMLPAMVLGLRDRLETKFVKTSWKKPVSVLGCDTTMLPVNSPPDSVGMA